MKQEGDPREYFVYRAFDRDKNLLYVGCTKNLSRRWSEHRMMRAEVTSRTTRLAVHGPYTRAVALQRERAAAVSEHPLYGWTPAKQSAIQVRRAMVNRRRRDLEKSGWPWRLALDLAEIEAKSEFGPAVQYFEPWRPETAAAA